MHLNISTLKCLAFLADNQLTLAEAVVTIMRALFSRTHQRHGVH